MSRSLHVLYSNGIILKSLYHAICKAYDALEIIIIILSSVLGGD